MIEDELVKIWQSSPKYEVVKFEKSRLMLETQTGIDRFNKLVKNRDLREMAGGLIAVPVLAYMGYKSPYLLTKVGALLSILCGVFVMIKLQQAKKHGPGAFSEDYLRYLYNHKLHVQAQIHLLETILYWYILPFYVSVSLMFFGAYLADEDVRSLMTKQVLMTVFAIIIYYLNQQAVKKELQPRLAKINQLISVLEEK
jgi:hypothetical protein